MEDNSENIKRLNETGEMNKSSPQGDSNGALVNDNKRFEDHDGSDTENSRNQSSNETNLVEEPSFETLLDTLGHFGRFQIMIFALLTMADIMNAFVMMYLVFGPATPKWRCAVYQGQNQSVSHSFNWTTVNETSEEMCEYNGSKCIRFDFDDAFTSIVTEWDLVCDFKYIPKLITSILMFGLLIGSLGAAQVSDLFGRRTVLSVSSVLSLTLQTLVGWSVNWQMYAALRFLTGIFLGATVCMCYIMPMEFIGPKWRSFCGALGIWDLGSSLTALVAYLFHDWRHLAFFTGTFFVPLVIAIVIFVPESIRWLIQKRRFEDATKVIRRMARVNKKPVPNLDLLERIAKRQNQERKMESRYTYLDLFGTVKLASRTLVVMYCWFTASCIYYGIIVSVPDLSGNMYLNTVYSSLPGMFLGWTIIPVANWLGRKRTYVLYISVPIVAMFGIVILNATGHIEKQATARTVLAIIGKITIGETWTVASLISSEIYPTLMRAIGLGIGNAASRVGGVIAPQIVLLGDVVHWTLPYIINGCLALISVILVLVVFPETNGRPLPEDAPPAGQCLKRIICCRKDEGQGHSNPSRNCCRPFRGSKVDDGEERQNDNPSVSAGGYEDANGAIA